MPETTPLIKAALNLRVGAGFDVYKEPKSVQEIMDEFYFDSRTSFRRKYLTPMLKNGVLKMTIPEKPSSKNQKYFS